ncbi:MAG: GMC family oxidoreductase N-terminal domain-containing protein [Leucobacter sp.]
MDEHIDVIVVGGGTAGCVLTRRLHDAGRTVALLEAGGDDTNPAIHEPSRMHELWHSPEDWDYSSVPQAHAGGRTLHLPRGKVLGGSHALNGMIFVRCAPEDFDGWADAGDGAWAWKEVLPLYKGLERFDRGGSELRGGEGLLDVVRDYRINPIQTAIIAAAVSAGIPFNDDYNGESLEGVSQQQITFRDGKRLTTYGAFVRPILGSPGLRVERGCWVHRLLLDGDRVVGVEVEQDGEMGSLLADEVVLCAGAIDSPRILLRSGIGPADELSELGIPVVVDSPEVGRELQDHFLTPVIFTTDAKPVPEIEEGMGLMQTHLFWKSRPELAVPDTQPVHFSKPMYEEWMSGPESGFTLMGGLIAPKSRGSVRLSGPDPHDPVLIDLNMFTDEEDLDTMLASVRLCERVGAASPLSDEWGARQLYPDPAADDEALRDYIRRTTVTYHHVAGSCRMGADAEAVVDPRLAVNGVRGLRVADASIMPTITSGNTNAPCMVIGELAARFVLADAGSQGTPRQGTGVLLREAARRHGIRGRHV